MIEWTQKKTQKLSVFRKENVFERGIDLRVDLFLVFGYLVVVATIPCNRCFKTKKPLLNLPTALKRKTRFCGTSSSRQSVNSLINLIGNYELTTVQYVTDLTGHKGGF